MEGAAANALRQTPVPAELAAERRARFMELAADISAARLAQIVQCDRLTSLAQSNVYWDEIISIEPAGEAEVYDLTVDDLHNFVAADLVSHNSIEQDADIVMFIYRDDVYNPESERKNIADIIVAKHRNGPVGEVSLYFQASQTRFRDLELNPPAE